MAGALFPGMPVMALGHNRNLGWAFTVNDADRADVYLLDVNPENPNQYRLDGQWLDLEVRTAPIKVKLLGRLSWTVKEEVLWSIYGPVVRRPHGTYAVRYVGHGQVGIYEQLYRMNKARDFDEWQAAMRLEGGLPDEPDIQAAVEILRAWDLRTNPESTGATIAVWTFQSLGFPDLEDIEPAALAEGFAEAVRTLKKAHGRVDVPWSEVNRLQRGDLGLGGGPDVLHAVFGEMYEKEGCLRGRQGDSYVMLVTWDKNGRVSSRSIHQYGSATLDETSPHYADQSPLFIKCQLKPVWLDEVDIRTHLEGEYRPGEEIGR